MRARVLTTLAVAWLAACQQRATNETNRSAGAQPSASRSCTEAEARAERDDIYQLLAYAVVSARWQDDKAQEGHHIGAILVSADGEPLYWATNNNFLGASAIEHAEARVIRGYLARRHRQGHHAYRLSGDTVYSTLEPCAMCVGTMGMAGVTRVVYGQTDPRFGRASERLRLDSRSHDGFAPYPDAPESQPSSLALRARIESAHRTSGTQTVTAWLDTPAARALFAEARETFERFQPQCSANASPLRRARGLFGTALRQSPSKADSEKESTDSEKER